MTQPDHPILLVTGASSGIGLATAHHMANLGWRVFATVRRSQDFPQLNHPQITPLIFDYDDLHSITQLVNEVAHQTGGRIDALFNNGAYGQPGAVEDLTAEVLSAQLRTNLIGPHELTRQVIPYMRAQGFGRIVQCSSFLGFTPMHWRGAYVASKFALEGLSETLRMELSGSGIEVSIIQPGPIATSFVAKSMAMFHAHIDMEGSPHRAVYQRRLANLEKGGANLFKLPPQAVAKKVAHALTAKRLQTHYRITWPAHAFAILVRLLPKRALYAIITAIARDN